MIVDARTRNEKGLTKKQAKYIDAALANPQLPQAEVARMCNIHPNTISEWKHDAAFVKALDEGLMEQWKDLKRAAQDSMAALVAEANFQACKYVLDSNGYAPTQKIEATVDTNIINIGFTECED